MFQKYYTGTHLLLTLDLQFLNGKVRTNLGFIILENFKMLENLEILENL